MLEIRSLLFVTRTVKVERALFVLRDCSGGEMCVATEFRPVYHSVLSSPWAESGEKRFYMSPVGLWKVEFQK